MPAPRFNAPSLSRSPKAAVKVMEPASDFTVAPTPSRISSPACSTTLPPVLRTVTPALTVTLSMAGVADSPAVRVRLPALVTLAATVSGLEAVNVVVVPRLVEAARPNTLSMVSAPVLLISTAPAAFENASLPTAMSRLSAAPMPLTELMRRLSTVMSACSPAVPSMTAPAKPAFR